MSFILTLKFNAELQIFFEEQRQLYYPAHLNQIPAHACVFYYLPEKEYQTIHAWLLSLSRLHEAQTVQINGIVFLGKGNAYRLEFTQTWFSELKKQWLSWLKAQDQHRWNPHVTIQNKTSLLEAKLLYQELIYRPIAQQGTIIGLDLWRYLEGPWELINSYYFNHQ